MLLMPNNPSAASLEMTFLSKYGAALDLMLRVGDAAVVVVTAFLCYWGRFGSLAMGHSYVSILLPAVLFVLLLFPAFGLYRSWRGEEVLAEIGRVASAWITVLTLLIVSEWAINNLSSYSRIWIFSWFVSTIALLGIYRWVARWLLGSLRTRGMDTRRVVVVGATHAGQRIIEAARSNPWMGLDVIAQVPTAYDQDVISDIPLLGDVDTFIESLRLNTPDQIWIALPLRAEALIQQLLEATSALPTTVRLIPDLFGYELIHQGATVLAGVPVITLQGSRVDGKARIIKAIEDRVLATLILLLISPLMLLIAIGVKIGSRGPVLFRQSRHGIGGKVVEVWKFRTMHLHQEDDGNVTQASRGDPRVTRLGRFLRSSSLDELPQFINVLQGRMSIVGPRPHAVEHNNHYQHLVWCYMQRHHVKPGITGWAQINGFRGETDALEKMAKRVEYDLAYIRNWSLWLDLRIIAITSVRGFFHKNSY